jgi:hypothetical protein
MHINTTYLWDFCEFDQCSPILVQPLWAWRYGLLAAVMAQLPPWMLDEDITMLDTPKIWSSMSYKLSQTWSSRLVWTQPTTLSGNADISFIRR